MPSLSISKLTAPKGGPAAEPDLAFPWRESLAFGVGLLACALFWTEPAASVVSLVLLAAFMLWTARTRIAFYVKYLPLVFAVLINVAGCALIEYYPTYLYELRLTSFFTGALPLLVFSRWLFIVGLFAFDAKWGVELSEGFKGFGAGVRGNRWLNVFAGLTLVVLVVMFAYVAPNPSFLMGVDRFAYAKSMPHFMLRFSTFMTYLILLPLLALRWGDKRIGGLSVVIYVLYMFWTGVKFGGFFALVCLVLLVFYDKVFELGARSSGRVLALAVVLIAALLGVTLFAASFTTNRTPMEFLSARLGQQGQLWSDTYYQYLGDPHPEELHNEIEALGRGSGASENVGSRNGIYGIMYLNAPEDVVDAKLASGSRYAEAGYAAMFYYFGPGGAIAFSLVFALLMGALVNGLLRLICGGELISAVIVFRLYMVAQTSLSQFTFHDLVDKVSLLSYAVLIVLLLLPKVSPKLQGLKLKVQMKSRRDGGNA